MIKTSERERPGFEVLHPWIPLTLFSGVALLSLTDSQTMLTAVALFALLDATRTVGEYGYRPLLRLRR